MSDDAKKAELIQLLKDQGLSDEEIAELGNDPDVWASMAKHYAEKVITIEISIPEGQDREVTPEEWLALTNGAYGAIEHKMMLSTALSVAGTAAKTAISLYLKSQTGGLLG